MVVVIVHGVTNVNGTGPGGWGWRSGTPSRPLLHASDVAKDVTKDVVNDGTTDLTKVVAKVVAKGVAMGRC